MAVTFEFRTQLLGLWDDAKGFLVQQFESLIAQLTPIAPFLEHLTLPFTASSIMMTDSQGTPGWSRILPKGIGIGAVTTGVTRQNGSTILPDAQNVQAAIAIQKPTTGSGLGASFFTTSTDDWSGTGPQGLESYLVASPTGTVTRPIALIGNIEHAGSGSLSDVRCVQGGGIISGTGGGTDWRCFFAAPSGRAFGGSGTFTNAYGFVCSAFGSGFLNKFAFYSADAVAGIFLASDTAVKLSTSSWQVSSDRRLKQNIRPFIEGLAILKAIQPVNYELNGVTHPEHKGKPGVSVIAQDAAAVLPPELRALMIGTHNINDEPYLTWDASALTYMLINAVKELSARLDALETKKKS